jgi:hypothetical protein
MNRLPDAVCVVLTALLCAPRGAAAAEPGPPDLDPLALEAVTDAALHGPPGCQRYALTWQQSGRLGVFPFEASGTATAVLDEGAWRDLELGEYRHGASEVQLDLGGGPLPFLPPLIGKAAEGLGPSGSLFGELITVVSGEATTIDLAPRPGGGWVQTRGLNGLGRFSRSNIVTIEHDAALRPVRWHLDARKPTEGIGRITRADVQLRLDPSGAPIDEQVEIHARLLLALVLKRGLQFQAVGACAAEPGAD